MSDFTHLHVHSHYSLLDGLGKTELLLQRAKELGMKSMGLTDHGVMYGIVDFVRKAKDFDIKPIIGVEAYLAPNGHKKKRGKIDANPRHVTLLAQNITGYKNLIQLTTKAHLEGYYYKPRIDYKLLKKHSEGLIVLSGCLNGDVARAIVEKRLEDANKIIEWSIDVVGRDRLYLEVQHHPTIPEQQIVNEILISLSKKYRLPLVATCDSHYINSDDAEAQDVLLCVQTGRVVQDKDRMCMLGEDYSLKSAQEMNEVWKQLPEAVENTQRIAEQCQVELEFGVNRLPHYPLPPRSSTKESTDEYTADEYLRELCEKSLLKRYNKDGEETRYISWSRSW
jgi:DNA polymerase-3 subunit alpha